MLLSFCLLTVEQRERERHTLVDPQPVMGMHVPSPVEAGTQRPCVCVKEPSSAGRPSEGKPQKVKK